MCCINSVLPYLCAFPLLMIDSCLNFSFPNESSSIFPLYWSSLLTQLTFFLNSFCPPVLSPCFPSGSDEGVTSPTSDRAAVAKKRFTLQGFSNLKAQKGNCMPEIFHYPLSWHVIFCICETKKGFFHLVWHNAFLFNHLKTLILHQLEAGSLSCL